jgi:hypothetical protein
MKFFLAMALGIVAAISVSASPTMAQSKDRVVQAEPPAPGTPRNPFPKRPKDEKRLVCTTDKIGKVTCVWQ